jgi:hypothetical protein
MQIRRFLHNDAVSVEEMADAAAARTQRRVKGGHVLAIQDTTVLASEGGGGQYLHAMIAVDADDDTLYGLVHAIGLDRPGGKRDSRHLKAVGEKESRRWVDCAEKAGRVLAGAERITIIGDRESDIFGLYASRPAHADIVVRVGQDRRLESRELLFARLDGLEVAGESLLTLPARPGIGARDIRLAFRYGPVEVIRPGYNRKKGDPQGRTIALHAVDVRQIDPEPKTSPIHWRLITSHPVESLQDAEEIVALYRKRWQIEQLFRTLKLQGFDLGGIEIADNAARRRLSMAALVAAVSIQQLVHGRDGPAPGRPNRPATDIIDEDEIELAERLNQTVEGQTQKQKNPHPKGSLAYLAWVCARLGGWTGYYGKPGPKVMLNGFLAFQSATATAKLLTAAYKENPNV